MSDSPSRRTSPIRILTPLARNFALLAPHQEGSSSRPAGNYGVPEAEFPCLFA